jgi:Mrp family chromosome partitioning ATPase
VNAASLLSSGHTLALTAEMRERFDLVLIDSPPIAGLADGLILASLSDVVVLVVRAGITKPADVTAAANSLLHNMTPIAGMVVFEELPIEPYYPAPHAESQAKSEAVLS